MASLDKVHSQFETLRMTVEALLNDAATPTERYLMARNVALLARQNSLAPLLNVPKPPLAEYHGVI